MATIEAQARAQAIRFRCGCRTQLYRNLGNGRFEDVSDRAGAVFKLADVGRGAAFGDIDNDGDTDVVIGNAAGPLRLLINNIGNRGHWLGLRLVGARPPDRDMVGARVEILRSERSDAVPKGPRGWQLRVGQRSANSRRPGSVDGASRASAFDGPMAAARSFPRSASIATRQFARRRVRDQAQ